MLSSLPSLAPRDSYALWYTSNHHSNNPTSSANHQEPVNHAFDHLAPPQGPTQSGAAYSQRRPQHLGSSRSPLARLRADEVYMDRRKQNVQNYGSSWIKPPGVFKSLHQLREERREMEEHQEALRREQLAQELAEAEAGEELVQGEGGEGEMETARDLDDDIPEAETTGLGGNDSDDEGVENDGEAAPRGVLAQRMPEEAYREALVQGEEVLGRRFAGEAGSDTDDETQSQMLQEEDLVVHEDGHRSIGDYDVGMDMNADLDDDVPDAEPDEYEHTDTEAELSTSDEEDDNSVNLDRWPQGRALSTSMVRSDGAQNSLEMGSMDTQSDISFGRSSPRQRSGSRRFQRGQH